MFSRHLKTQHAQMNHGLQSKALFKSTSVSVVYAFEESVDFHLLLSFCDDSNLHISLFKCVLSTIGISKESISKFLIGNRFHVQLHILSPENCKQSLRVKSWKAEVTAEKNKLRTTNKNFVTQAHKSTKLCYLRSSAFYSEPRFVDITWVKKVVLQRE